MKSLFLVPPHFEETKKKMADVYRVDYLGIAKLAETWAKKYSLQPSSKDSKRICLMPIDCQNTFCVPGFELFVAGQTGNGAVEDNIRLCEFIYRNLGVITQIFPTMDTHLAIQIFHPLFWVNDKGEHPLPNATMISVEDVEKGIWKPNPAIVESAIGANNYVYLQKYALHYVRRLAEKGKYALMVWAYHAMLGGIGHALVSGVEETIFFHTVARRIQTGFEIKGGNPLTENYSVLSPEVLDSYDGSAIAQRNARFIQKLINFDTVIITGQAKSHCVAWTIDDLLTEIKGKDPALAKKVYLLEDCTSSVVIPGVIDFTEPANDAFKRFSDEGMHVVKSTDPIETWPGINL